MGEDEEGTLAALTAHRTELIDPASPSAGAVVTTTGDGLLVEFASVVDAVRCSMAFQDGMRERNADTLTASAQGQAACFRKSTSATHDAAIPDCPISQS